MAIIFEKFGTTKKTRGWRARLGGFEGQGATKALAQSALFSAIAREPHTHVPVVRMDARGNAWVLSRLPGSWTYRTPTGCACMMGGSEQDAVSAMESHISNYYA